MEVYYPNEIDTNELVYADRCVYDNGDWSQAIYYGGEELTLQLCNAKCLFGVLSYKNPQANNLSPPKYSTGVCLDQLNSSVQSFKTLCETIEDIVADYYKGAGTFVSSIKVNKRGESHLRIKLPVRYEQPQFGIYYNSQKISATFEELKNELYHGREINIMLSLNPVWCSGSKFGVSWKLVAIEFLAKRFRNDKQDKKLFPLKSLTRTNRHNVEEKKNESHDENEDETSEDNDLVIPPKKVSEKNKVLSPKKQNKFRFPQNN